VRQLPQELRICFNLSRKDSSAPHWAIVGRVPGTEHFRNVKRHDVVLTDDVTTLRIDESLTFLNARFLEDTVYGLIADQPQLKHLILMCPAINHIDSSALESLEAINLRLKDAGVTLHLSEVKGPVMDRLKGTHLLHDLTGKIFLSQHEACAHVCDLVREMSPNPAATEPTP
jgi:sulfate permease, SulP family